MAMISVSQAELRSFADLTPERTIEGLTLLGVPVDYVMGDELALEITPNRPDLLSVEGVGRALASFAFSKNKKYSAAAAGADDYAKVEASVAKVRPLIGAGIARGVRLDDKAIKSLMQLQEKLHDTLGRKRKKVAIGVHDLAVVRMPLRYEAVGLDAPSFIPLEAGEKMTPRQILARHPKGVAYKHLVGEKAPLITDANGDVVSFPPIINAERTKLREGERDLLVEVTGTNEEAVRGALNIVLCALADRGGKLGCVRIGKEISPNFEGKKMKLPLEAANKVLGMNFSKGEVSKMLIKMGYEIAGEAVIVPPFRTDVMHAVDLIEDIAVVYDYNKFEPSLPDFFSIGRKREGHPAHEVLVGMKFSEVITWTLSGRKALAKANLAEKKLMEIANPLTEDFTSVRPSLIPSLLSVFAESKDERQPQRIYEIGIVASPVEEQRIACAILDSKASFSAIKSVAVGLLREFGVEYEMKEGKHSSFIDGRCAEIFVKKKSAGFFGEISPQVLNNFGLEQPVALLEMKAL